MPGNGTRTLESDEVDAMTSLLCNCEASIQRLEDAVLSARVQLDQAYEFAFDNVAKNPRLCKETLDVAEVRLTEAEIDLAIAMGGVL